MSSAETPSADTPEPTGINWEDVFDTLGMDPAEAQSTSQVRSAAQIAVAEITNADDAAEAIEEAVDAGELVQDGGIHVAGFQPSPDVEDEGDEQPDEPPEEESADETVEVDSDIIERIENLEEQNEQQAKAIAELRQKNSTLMEALTNFVEPDAGRTVVGELPSKMRDRGDTFERTSQTISRVNRLVDEIDEELGDAETQTTDGRVMQLRRFLVQQAERQGNGGFAMDYNAVATYFNSQPGDSISDSWASQLQTKAAQGHHAFSVDKSDGKKKIRVELDKIDQGSVYRLKNSAGEEGE